MKYLRTFHSVIIFFFIFSLKAQLNQLNYLPQDSIFFEYNTLTVSIDPSPSCIWQIGMPGKSFLNQAYSLPKAIMTDTLHPYPENNTSSFTFTIDSNSIWNNPIGSATYFSFIHKYDTDTLNDYGIIEASIDGGESWCNLSDPSCFQGYILGSVWWEYDSSITSHRTYYHSLAFSGKSDGWIFSRIHIDYACGKSIENGWRDSILVRFTFHSDGGTSGREGWLIDNIIIGACDIYLGALPAKEIENKAEVIPNPLLTCSRIQLPEILSGINEILIFNYEGKIIMRKPVILNETPLLYGKDFPAGIYLIRMMAADGRFCSGKFTVK